MGLYRLTTTEYEVVEYEIIYEVEAENEKDAEQQVLKGNAFTIDSSSMGYFELNEKVAQDISSGDFKLITVNSIEKIKTPQQIKEEKRLMEIEELKKKIIELEKQGAS